MMRVIHHILTRRIFAQPEILPRTCKELLLKVLLLSVVDLDLIWERKLLNNAELLQVLLVFHLYSKKIPDAPPDHFEEAAD